MAFVHELLSVLEQIAPEEHTLDGDHVGLQVGSKAAEVSRVTVALDRSLEAIAFAKADRSQVLLTHHPLLFKPVATVDLAGYEGRAIHELITAGISCVAAHTNWDAAVGGVNDELAARLGLQDVVPFGTCQPISRLKLCFFCPSDQVDAVIDAVAAAGGGQIDQYSRCAFLSPGTGTFVPGTGSAPFVGEPGEITRVPEVRVEMVVPRSCRARVTTALLAAHPYETPAFEFYELAPVSERPLGRLGNLAAGMTLEGFLAFNNRQLGSQGMAWGDPKTRVSRVAVVGGSGDGDWKAARDLGADVLVTGEVRQHVAVEASECGIAMISAGHFATENPGVEALASRLQAYLPEVSFVCFTPKPGHGGRPFYSLSN